MFQNHIIVKDTGILRYLRWTNNIFSYYREISHKQLDKILKKIIKLKLFFINKNDNNNKIILKTSKFILTILDKYTNNLVGSKHYSIRNIDILKIDDDKIIYNLKIFKQKKTHSFTLQININIKEKKIKNIIIIGINIEDIYNNPENLKFDDYFKLLPKDKISKNYSFNKYEYNCSDGLRNKYECLSKNKIFSKGVWDKPCEKNTECPFYNGKKGGCINNYCQLPVNLIPVGFRGYKGTLFSSRTRRCSGTPLCYDCKINKCKGIGCFNCCYNQRNNKNGPKYIF